MTSRSAALFAWGVALTYAVLLAAAAIPAFRPVLWGVHAWSYLPAPAVAGAGALALGLIFLILAAPKFPGNILPALLVSLLFAPFFYLFRDATHLLGDGRLWISVLAEQRAHHAHEPLAFAAALVVTLGKFVTSTIVESRMEVYSAGLGVVAVFLTLRTAARLAESDRGRWTAFGLLLGMGILQFGFGYVESYPLFWVAILLYVHLALEAVLGRLPFFWTGLAFGFAGAVHGSGFLLAPSFLVLLLIVRPKAGAIAAAFAAAILAIAFAYFVLPLMLPSASSSGAPGGFRAGSWNRLFREFKFYPYGIPAWALGQINRWALASGAAVSLVVASLVASRKPPTKGVVGKGSPNRGLHWFLAAAALGLGLPAVLLDMEGSRGAAADWDAFSVAAVPLMALAALRWSPHVETSPGVRRGLAATAGLGLFGALCFVGANASQTAALDRFATLADHVFITPRAKSWAYESLAVYYRNKQELKASADFYQKSVGYQTTNARLIHNTASMLVQTKQYGEAAEMYRRLTALEPKDATVWFSFGAMLEQSGRPDSAMIAYRQSLRFNPNFTEPMNYLARLVLRTPAGREEGRALIVKSLEINPNQSTAAWGREMLKAIDSYNSGAGGTNKPPEP